MALRPAHLFSLAATSQETKGSEADGWGPLVKWKAYIWMSASNSRGVSGLPGSVPKNTDATTDFSSISIPARAAACLTMAWVFWRTALIDVWYTT